MFRSIRFRLALWYTFVIALTFLLFSFVIYQYLEQTLSFELDRSVTSELRWVAARMEKRNLRKETADVVREDIFEHAAYYPRKEYIEVWDSNGTLFYQSANLTGDMLAGYSTMDADTLQLWTIRNFRDHEIRLALEKSFAATVYLAMPTGVTTAPLNYLLQIFAWLGPILVVIAFVGGTYLAKKSFAKVNQIIETAKRISADRLYDRIPEHTVPDEIGNLTATFNAMIARLDNSFEQMKQFSADASHELRTPLTVMRTQLENALDNKTNITQQREIAAHCLDECIHMSNIVESLLLLAKADAGQQLIKMAPCDLKAIVRQIYEECVILASQKSITVTLKNLDEAAVSGDIQRIRQMLLNLIDNAIKYSNVNGKIYLSLEKKGGEAVITVADNGIGIAENEIPRIFDRFYRVDRARSRSMGGAGLGLAITQWIVHSHQGTISVKSEPGNGSVFSVFLPLYNSSDFVK